MLTSANRSLILFPDLFPGLVLLPPFFRSASVNQGQAKNPAIKKQAVSFMHQVGKPWAPPPPSDFAGTRTEDSSGLGLQGAWTF